MEGLLRLESDDTRASRDAASKIHSRLKSTRDPLLLGELVDFYFQTYSKRTRKILTTLGEAHSQDYFEKLLDCLQNGKVLAVFKLLAHTLNSQHANWLYRIVDHPLFSCILQHLEESEDVMVLAMGVLVLAAILPLVPTYIGSHLEHLFSIFCDLATIRATDRLGLTPNELVMHLDVSVYYFFLQLYALFPCNLFSFFKSYCLNSSRAQVNAFQEFVAPLFYQVQLHPGLVMDSCSYELSKAKWGAMEPSDIATLSLQFCIDTLLSPTCGEEEADGKDGICKTSRLPVHPTVDHAIPIIHRPSSLAIRLPPPEPSPVDDPSKSSALQQQQQLQLPSPMHTSDACVSTTTFPSLLAGPQNPGGLKPDEELCKFWSPSVSLGQISTQSSSVMLNESLQSGSLHLHSSSSYHLQHPTSSSVSSPKSDSTMSSTIQTPAVPPTATGGHNNNSSGATVPPVFTFKNYSPTASMDGESLFSRVLSQSVVHTPSMLEESFSSRQLDPMSQSVRVETSSSHPGTSPSKISRSFASKSSFKNRLSLFFGIAKKEDQDASVRKASQVMEKQGLDTNETEDFVEVFMSSNDVDTPGQYTKGRSVDIGITGGGVVERGEEVKEESVEVHGKDLSYSSVQSSGEGVSSSGGSDSPEDIHRESGYHGFGQLMELDISKLPRVSRSSSESSQASHNLDPPSDSPNTAGTGRFNAYDQSSHHYNSVGASTAFVSRMSSSYPRTVFTHVGAGRHSSRAHTSNSETIQCVKDRLQGLIEENRMSSLSKTSNGEGKLEVANEKVASGIGCASEPSLCTPSASDLSHLPGLSPMRAGRITLRRVSVCSRKVLPGNSKMLSESSDGATTITHDGSQDQSTELKLASLPMHPSPVALLDQFVTCGEVLHCGGLDTVPLTEQEGIDWNHFGGCPHSEEFRIMQSQVVLLHSQMLFERHQCLQHARRNRRLLSKARSATHVAQELVSLREQLQQQEALVTSLQQQLTNVSKNNASREPFSQDMDGCLVRECESLKDKNARLEQDLQESAKEKMKLEEDLQMANKRIFDLENAQQDFKSHLEQAGDLQGEVRGLTAQLHVLSSLYQQQNDRLQSFHLLAQQEAEWIPKMDALAQEKDKALRDGLKLRQQLEACQAQLEEHEVEKRHWEEDLEKMRVQREDERGRAWTKIKALEEKYGSMRVIGQQLETHVLELKGRGPLHRRMKTHSRHRRNHSSASANTPSPSNMTVM